MAKSDSELHHECMQRFIDLANSMKDEGIDTKVVSAGMMTASGLYTTFVLGGNDGGLTASGIDKVVAVYKEELEKIQRAKKNRAEQ